MLEDLFAEEDFGVAGNIGTSIPRHIEPNVVSPLQYFRRFQRLAAMMDEVAHLAESVCRWFSLTGHGLGLYPNTFP